MLDLDREPRLRRLFNVARWRVAVGFFVAVAALVLATPTWMSIAAGTAIGLAGEALRLWAAGHLVKGSELTTSGPYRWMRHPLYAGSGIMGVGFSVGAASWLAAVLVLGYFGLMTAVAIPLEEATLRDTFGEAHARYVAGEAPPPAGGRRFSLRRALDNGEAVAFAGLVSVVIIFAVKVLER